MEAIDELVARWRNNPDCEATVALCAHLSTHPERELLREVGQSAETWHHGNAEVMLSLGRMYLQCGMLAEAQTAFVQSGRVSPKNWHVHRYLGETLLRRGDAARAEKVLQRAIALGATDSATRLWRERAAVYSGLQKHKGSKAVAREVERTAPIARNDSGSDSPPSEESSPVSSATRQSRPPAPSGGSAKAEDAASQPMPTLYGVGKPPTAESLRAAAHPAGTLPRSPSPDDLLATLSRVGLFEPNSALKPAWESAPPARRSKRPWIAGATVAMIAFGGLGIYRLAENHRVERVAQAQAIATGLSDNLASARVDALEATEEDFKKLFELDSRSPQAAVLWLENRVVHALLGDEAVSGLEAALTRARAVGVDSSRLAFGVLASSLFHEGSQSAAAALSANQPSATDNGLYPLVAGSLLERQGDPEALTQYKAAVRRMPNNKVAHLLAAKLAILMPPSESTLSFIGPALSRLRDTPSGPVLAALFEATTPSTNSPNRTPFDIQLVEGKSLPTIVKPLAYAAHALGQLQREDTAQAMIYFGRALRGSRSAFLDHWIARQALQGNLPNLSRQALTQAVARSAKSEEHRLLLARTSLAFGDYAGAAASLTSDREGQPLHPLLEASQAYESLQVDTLTQATRDSTKLSQYTRSLALGVEVLSGRAARTILPKQLANAAQAWGTVVAVDLALDRGDLAEAQELLTGLSANSPQVSARRARLRRALGDPRGAVVQLAPILTAGASSPRQQIEAVLTLVGAGNFKAARDAMQSEFSANSPQGPWLTALLTASQASPSARRKTVKKLTLPASNAPLLIQTLSLRALTTAGDRRAKKLYARLSSRHAAHPDVRDAGIRLGLARKR